MSLFGAAEIELLGLIYRLWFALKMRMIAAVELAGTAAEFICWKRCINSLIN